MYIDYKLFFKEKIITWNLEFWSELGEDLQEEEILFLN
jgi:hypothetical protein